MCPQGLQNSNIESNEINQQQPEPNESNWKHIPILSLCKIFKLLSPKDRLSASSTCRTWRSLLFEREIWPSKSLEINLCSYKLTVERPSRSDDPQAIAQQFQADQFQKSGLFTFSVQRYCSILNYDRSKNHNRLLKRLLRSCDKFLENLTVYFDPNSANNVIDLIQIIRHLSLNEATQFMIGKESLNFQSNCNELRSIRFVPINPLIKTVHSERFVHLYHELTDQLRILLSKCHRFESISIGNLHELASSIDELFKDLLTKESNRKSLKNLDFCTMKGDPFGYIETNNKLQFLSQLKALQSLSLDFDVISSELIEQMCDLSQLQSFTINVHRFNYNHNGLKPESTHKLHQSCPKLRLTINLLHIDSVHLEMIKESLLNSDLSLKTLRIYYLDLKDIHCQLFFNMLDLVSRRHAKTIETLILVDHMNRPKRFFKYSNVNSIVMLSWMCRQLHYLTIVGYELSSADVIAIARLRGTSLRNFYLPSSCIDFQFEQYPQFLNYRRRRFEGEISRYFNDCISIALERPWRPIDWQQIPEMIDFQYSSLLTYHRTMIEQNILL